MKKTNNSNRKWAVLLGLFIVLNLLGCSTVAPPPAPPKILKIDASALAVPLTPLSTPVVKAPVLAEAQTTKLTVLKKTSLQQAKKKRAKKRSRGYFWNPGKAKKGPVAVVVSLADQKAYIYRNGVRIAHSKVSTGKRGYETPTGSYKILQKRKKHKSNLYENADMPYMQRLTWDGIALHGGRVPNYPASHGCIRFPHSFARKLYGITGLGSRVVIADYHPGDEVF